MARGIYSPNSRMTLESIKNMIFKEKILSEKQPWKFSGNHKLSNSSLQKKEKKSKSAYFCKFGNLISKRVHIVSRGNQLLNLRLLL